MKSKKYHLFNLKRNGKISKKLCGIIIHKNLLSKIKKDNTMIIIPKNIPFYYFEQIGISSYQQNFSIIENKNGKLHILKEYSFYNMEYPNEIVYASNHLQKELEDLQDIDVNLAYEKIKNYVVQSNVLLYRIYNSLISEEKYLKFRRFIENFYDINSEYVVLDNLNIKE